MAKTWQNGYAFFTQEDDGSVTVTLGTNPNAPDRMETRIVAAPAIWCSDKERGQRVAAAIQQIIMRGLIVSKQRRIHNQAFDKPGERTTTVLDCRPCRNEEEAEQLLAAIYQILEATDAQVE